MEQINTIYDLIHNLNDEDILKKTEDFKQRYKDGESLDSILPEAYALVKEVCRRLVGKTWNVTDIPMTWDMVPFDVQLMGAIELHQGKISEMATGEGKTLVATMPLYLNALTGKGCHLVTVNDYLARRDAEWMGMVYNMLGVSVAYIQNDMIPQVRKESYNADITYGTNSEFGFDYLRDNMVLSLDDKVQRGHYYAIVDEVDSILIDEARTPLIISGAVDNPGDKYYSMFRNDVERLTRKQTEFINKILFQAEKLLEEGKDKEAGIYLLQAKRGAPKNKKLSKLMQDGEIRKLIERVEAEYMREKKLHLLDEDLFYTIDEKGHSININEKGHEALSPDDPTFFVLPDSATILSELHSQGLSIEEIRERESKLNNEILDKSMKLHAIHQLLKAFSLFEKDVDYVVQNNRVIIVDEFTGRLLPGRRYSDGLHQALEAKEKVIVQQETQTLATITIQNYFRLYEKLAGMTGTAETESTEFWQIYKLDVSVIPTNKPVRRVDTQDEIFKTRREKYNEVIKEIERLNKQKRPVLVGTTSVEASEQLHRLLRMRNIPHSVLNAKYHQQEAEIVAQAGKPGTVTIATNMAGRGTDIKLQPATLLERLKWLENYIDYLEEELGSNKLNNYDRVQFEWALKHFSEILRKVKLNELGLSEHDSIESGNPDILNEKRRILCKECCINSTPDMVSYKKERLTECSIFPACGLAIIGTERHEARRIDRQLRGRSGRQGDPGSSKFYLSLEDDLMRLFGSDRVTNILNRLGGLPDGEPIVHPWVTKAIQRAQKRVEMQNFQIRKHLLEYDDVMNKQREVIYGLRNKALEGKDLWLTIDEMLRNVIDIKVMNYLPPDVTSDEWKLNELKTDLERSYFLHIDLDYNSIEGLTSEQISDYIIDKAIEHLKQKEQRLGKETMEKLFQYSLLKSIDEHYREHLLQLDHLKEGISLRAYGQKDPLVEYKKESFEMFNQLLDLIDESSIRNVFLLEPATAEKIQARAKRIAAMHTGISAYDAAKIAIAQAQAEAGVPGIGGSEEVEMSAVRAAASKLEKKGISAKIISSGDTYHRGKPKVGRNDPCPCGSGKKYKKCCGRNIVD